MGPTAGAAGFANDGWLKILKKSARKRRFWPSVILNILPRLKSAFFCGGPMRQLRGLLP